MIKYQAALLDIDGTLIDSNDAHAKAWVAAFAAHGRRVDFSRVRPLIGKGGDKLLSEVAGIDAESSEGKALSQQRLEIFQRDYLPHLKATRGARGLLEQLRDQGLTLAIATSAQSSELGDLLRVAGLADLIHTATSSDDAQESKPDPDIIQAALTKAGCNAADAVMIGDTPYDVEAAGKAGVPALALRCGGWWSDEALAGAAEIYSDPEDLRQNFERSLFATGK